MLFRNSRTIYIIVLFVLAVILGSAFVVIDFLSTSRAEKIIFYSIYGLQTFLVAIFLFYIILAKSHQKLTIQKSFHFYVEEITSRAGVGLIVFDTNKNIIWTSTYLDRKGFHKYLGGDVNKVLDEFKVVLDNDNKWVIKFGGSFFEVTLFHTNSVVLLRDITYEVVISQKYNNERLVLAEFEIDNYAQHQADLGDEGLFKIQQIVLSELDQAVKDYQIIYRQYSNGKFIIIATRSTLEELKARNFPFLNNIHRKGDEIGLRISISIGIAADNLILRELAAQAQEGLKQAQSRGGDQIVVLSAGQKPLYFGATSEANVVNSKVLIRNLSERLLNRLADPDLSSVVIHGHINSDLDAMGSALGIRALVLAALHTNSKTKVVIANVKWDNTATKAINRLMNSKQIGEIFYDLNRTKRIVDEKSIAVIVDTSNHHLIEQFEVFAKIKKDNVFIFDHHRVGEIGIPYKQENTYIETSASSASEIVTELISFSQRQINFQKYELQMLLAGIYLDTNRFTKTTTWRTFAAASFLESHGAEPAFAIEILKMSEDEAILISNMLKEVQQIKPGYYLTIYDKPVSDDVVAKAADEMLRTAGREASFVIARIPDSHQYKLSARSIRVNVQKIVEAVGGGGHFSAAAARSSEKLDVFKRNIINAIVTSQNESNIN